MKSSKIYHGDCKDIMKGFEDNSIDTLITDPPAGISFMGKKWDSDKGGRDQWIEWFTGIMTECYRVLKPGSTALVWALPRTSHWTATAIEDAGFRINDIINHIFGQGFPKSLDIGKQLDKMYTPEQIIVFNMIRNKFNKFKNKKGLSLKEINKFFNFAINGSGMAGHWFANITQQTLPTKDQYFKLKKLLEFDNELDYLFINLKKGNERPIIGKGKGAGTKGNTFPFEHDYNITAPATSEAVLWDGYGTALKPAAENWILAMKPCEGTYAQNALKWGVAGLNIDGGRIDCDLEKEDLLRGRKSDNETTYFTKKSADIHLYPHTKGRFPANLILDSESAKVMDEQSGVLKSGKTTNKKTKNSIFGTRFMMAQNGSQGGASRFFKTLPAEPCRFKYQSKASKSERNRGCEGLEEKQQDLSRKEGNPGGDNPRNRGVHLRQNHHPCVKPLALMEYLCTLTRTPTGGIVLDPFMGSGTTGIACKNTGRDFIGIEKDPEYFKIAKCRINAADIIKINKSINKKPVIDNNANIRKSKFGFNY